MDNEETKLPSFDKPTFDARRTTLIDYFECQDCKYNVMYARTVNDNCMGPCPKCQSRCYYLKRLSGRVDDDPVKPSVRIASQPLYASVFDNLSVEELVNLMSDEDLEEMDQVIDGEEWKFGNKPAHERDDYDFFSEDGCEEDPAKI